MKKLIIAAISVLLLACQFSFAGSVTVGTAYSPATNYIEISNGSFIRSFDIGSWTRLRLAARIGMSGTTTLTAVTPSFIFGLSSGTNQIFDAAGMTNFIGFRTTNVTWTAGAGYFQFNKFPVYYKQGTTWSWVTNSQSGSTTGFTVPNSGASSIDGFSVMMMELEKGTPNWTIRLFARNDITALDITPSTFLTQMIAVNPSIQYHQWSSAYSFPFSEATGSLTNVCFGFDRFEDTIRISEIVIIKMQ